MEAIPPTRRALVQHIKRAVYTGGHCWRNMLKVVIDLPSAGEWGWIDPHKWKPLWSMLPETSTSSTELIRCKCKTGCKGRCKCKQGSDVPLCVMKKIVMYKQDKTVTI